MLAWQGERSAAVAVCFVGRVGKIVFLKLALKMPLDLLFDDGVHFLFGVLILLFLGRTFLEEGLKSAFFLLHNFVG